MSRGRSATTTKVFVGSLPADVTTDDLRKLFEPYGSIAECDIANRCGFLHLDDRDLAMKAITELNGTDFMGAKISVEKGRVKPRRPGGGGPMRGGGRGGDRGGPYSRGGGDFRNGGYGGRDGPPFRGGDRFGGAGGYDRMPQRGGYGGGMDDRRGGFDDRRPGYPDRFGGGYDDRRYDDRAMPGDMDGPMGGFEDRRGGYEDRRPLMGERRPMMDPPSRGPAAPDLFSRREGMAPKTGAYGERPYGGGAGTNGYGASAGSGYGDRSGFGGGYSGAAGGGGGGYGDSYGAGSAGRGRYDTSYPALPAQRSFASGAGGGPGTRRDMPVGRRF